MTRRKLITGSRIRCLHILVFAAVISTAGCGAGGGVGGGTSSLAPPILSMYDSAVDFGDVAVGATMTLGVPFSNNGGSPLTLKQNSVSGAGFTTAGVGAGVTLDPGQYAILAVSFDPSGPGKANGMVSLTSSTSSVPINLPLSGNAVTASHSVALDWTASGSSTSPVIGYYIYCISPSLGYWVRLNSSLVLATSYTHWGVQGSDSYEYAVTAVDATYAESRFSSAALAVIPAP